MKDSYFKYLWNSLFSGYSLPQSHSLSLIGDIMTFIQDTELSLWNGIHVFVFKSAKIAGHFWNVSSCETFNGLSYKKYILNKLLPFFHWSEYGDLWFQHYLQMFIKITKHCIYTCMYSMCCSTHYISITCNIAYILYIQEAKQNLSDGLVILESQFKKILSVNLDNASKLCLLT